MQTKRPLSQLKTTQLKHHLRDLAFRRGPDARLPTTRELCDLFGASSVTLNDALADLEAQNVICRKQGSGIYVSPKIHQKNVRIYFNSSKISRAGLSPFWGILSGLILAEAQRRALENENTYEFDLIPALSFRDPALTDELTKLYREGLLHGMLAIGMGEQPVQREFDADVPLVSYADSGHWVVTSPFADGARLGVGTLVDYGCEKIGVWTLVEGNVDMLDDAGPLLSQLDAIFSAFQTPFYPEFTLLPREFVAGHPDAATLIIPEQGYLMATKVFTQPGPKPDGLFIADDLFAEGVLTAFNELGIRPGVDVQIVSMCNAGSPILFGYEEVLTLLEYDPAELVNALFDVLEVLMSRGVPAPEMMMVNPKIIRPGNRMRHAKLKMRCGL